MSAIIGHLWQDKGYRFIAHMAPGRKKFRQRVFKSTDGALDFAIRQSHKGDDVWFSCGLFAEPQRSQENVLPLRGFWIDLDVGDDGKKYPTQVAAIQALKTFCAETGLPMPCLVNSGYGIHSYWLIDGTVEPTVWHQTADTLKRACYGRLNADPSRTADSASVMRIPVTWNYKRGGKMPVEELHVARPIALERFWTAISSIAIKSAPVTSDVFDIPSDFPPSSAHVIAEKCAVIASVRDTRGNVEEPLWYAALGMLRHTKEAPDICYAWSGGHPDYSESETTAKLAQWESKELGPTTCQKFESIAPALCAGCSLNGKLSSPIQVGIALEPATTESKVWPEKINGRWLIGTAGVYLKTEDDTPTKVLGVPMKIERISRHGFDDAVAAVHWITSSGKEHVAEMSLQTLGEQRQMRAWLFSKAIADWTNVGRVMSFLQDFVNSLNKQSDPDMVVTRFGWNGPAAFNIGSDEVTKSSVNPVRVSKHVPNRMRDGTVPTGNVDLWIKATEIFQNADYWCHAFTLQAALASPLLHLFDVEGSVLSLAGPSGTGKTTAAQFAISAFADPRTFVMSPQATMVAKGEMFRIAKNLPIAIDDIGNQSRSLSDLIYMAANGRAKERGNQDGTLRGQEQWQTLLILTTNSPVLDFPEYVVGEAERRRTLELSVETPLALRDAQMLNTIMSSNHGLIARHYLQAVLRDPDALRGAFRQLWDNFAARDDIPDANRFGIWLVTAAIIAGKIAEREGLIRFDPMIAPLRAIEGLCENVKATIDPIDLMQEAVHAFINENHSSITRMNDAKNWVEVCEKREVVATIREDEQIIYIPVKQLRLLLPEWGIPGTGYRAWRRERTQGEKNILMVPKGAPQRCVAVPLPTDLKGD